MKTVLAVSIMMILAIGVLAPALQQAYAHPYSEHKNSIQIAPKSYGEKTKGKFFVDWNKTQKSGFESVKKEEVKTIKKIAADSKAQELFKRLYRLG